jgi:hypothetical protein
MESPVKSMSVLSAIMTVSSAMMWVPQSNRACRLLGDLLEFIASSQFGVIGGITYDAEIFCAGAFMTISDV